jgi:hypothetical protein
MLKVGVHHRNELAASGLEAGDDGAREATLALAAGPVDDTDLGVFGDGEVTQDGLGAVVAVVDEDEVMRRAIEGWRHALHEGAYAVGLVAGGDNDGEGEGSGVVHVSGLVFLSGFIGAWLVAAMGAT